MIQWVLILIDVIDFSHQIRTWESGSCTTSHWQCDNFAMSIHGQDGGPTSSGLPDDVHTWDNKPFSQYVRRVRSDMINKSCFPLWRDYGDLFLKNSLCGKVMEVWYGEMLYYVKLVISSRSSLAWNIVHHEADLPRYDCDLEIIGDNVRETERKPVFKLDPIEDCSEEIANLPVIASDPEIHFAKVPTFKREIHHLLQCRGSPHIVQLLGRSENGQLVFPKIEGSFFITVMANNDNKRIENIKRWMLEIIDGVEELHSFGIIHRDLHWNNILVPESCPLIICDLQSHDAIGHCAAFEVDDHNENKFSFASDVFALGSLLWQCCFFNNPLNRHVLLDNPPPPPFRNIFLACTNEKPESRPALAQLKGMFKAIES